jgi:hypothetical protein
MKPLLALSLLLNLCLLTAFGYLLARGPQVVIEKEPVVVTKTLNPNIELETRVIALEAELAQVKALYADEVEKLAEAQEEIVAWERGRVPETLLLDGPRGYGQALGRFQRGVLTLSRQYPTRPPEGSPQYTDYNAQSDALSPYIAPYWEQYRLLARSPESDPDRQAFMAASVGATLGLDDVRQEQLDAVFASAYARLQEEGLLSEKRDYFFTSDRAKSTRREVIEQQAYEQTLALLTPEEQVFFDQSFGDDFLFSLKILFMD